MLFSKPKVNDTVTVTVVDLNGKSVPLADNDCNLVQETGCGKWNLKEWIKEWIKESNIKDSIDQYPMVTDYRWNDLPVTLTMEAFKEKIKISKYHNFKMHFSILANDSAQFLFTNDSTLNSGLNAVIDGWADDHKSVLRNCPKINGSKVDTSGVIYASCDKNSLVEKKGSDVLHAGRKWAHATLEIQFDKSNENYSIDLGEHIIKISLQTASAKLGDNDNYVSIRSTRSSRGLFKTHKYFIIRPNNASSTMEVQLKKDSTSAFCVDAVFLTNERINLGNKIFSVELLDAKGTKKFDERVSSMDNYFKWTTVRFGNKDITPKKGWKIKLTAYDKSLVIGGVKFCKEGELVTKTNMKYVDNCYSLEKRAQTQIPNTTHFNELLYKLGNCKENGGKCSGDKLCYSKENCTCFAGYKGTDCTERCTGDKFGIMCSYTNNRTCLNGSFSPVNGSCLNGCAIGYVYPECHKKIQTATPKVKSHGYDTVALDLLASLNGTVNISQILIQYKISSQSDWNNKSINVPNELNECSISNLNPKTEYTIRFTLFESDVMQHPQNFLPGNNSTFTTKCKPLDSTALKVRAVNSSAFSIHLSDGDVLCTPIYLTVVHNATVIVNQTENKGDFTKVVDNCNCGVHSITVYYFVNMSSSSLHENFTCSNCPTQDKLGNISSSLTPIATVLAVLAVLTGLGVWFYLKKWKNIQPPNQISSVQFSNNSAILRNEMLPNQTGANQFTDDNTEMPIDSSSTNVERYLQKALTFNLKKEFEKFPRGQTQSWDCGTKSQNKKKNRYGNLAAYDCSRVVLDLLPGDENSDYINANYVDGFERPKAYIATQGPKLSTVNDFWRMIWQENISLIVMVTNLVEDGKIKCEKYWPDINREENYGTVAVRSVNEEINADYVTRTLSFSSDNVNRLVQQLHYTSWPDHGVPLYPQSMALFIDKIIQHKNKNPILIHCSAGVGRTGTIILIDACLRMFRSHNRIDVLSIFGQMRSQRVNLVDNLAQFEFVHLVLLEIIANPKFEISCANFYEEYCKLMSNSEKLKESFAKVEMICEKDFQRLETPARNETDKCRYPDFIASSNAIVKLFPYENVVTMSFINAVIVDGYNRAKQFIATQVPMKNTVADFWRLIDQFNVKQIVVLTEPHISDGDFLPTKQRRFAFGAIQVTLADAEDDNNIRTLDIELHSKGKCKKVRVMCASFGWMPQQAAPPNLQPFIDLWGTLKTAHEKDSITIVCHDGVTASGLFLAMGFVIEKIKLEQKVDVGLAVRTLRKSRPSFVSSEIQFGLVYEAAKQYLNSFDTYGNFK